MNIKEVEQATGLKRGSIRFYEEEKLIKPYRNENGYRSYTEDDVALLKKIKLLRVLNVSIQDVKKVVMHDAPLSYVIEKNIYKLEQEKEQLWTAITICEKILDDGISFENMKEDSYLQLLERNLNQSQMNAVMDVDCSKRDEQAWQRYFARYIDLGVYGIVLWHVLFRHFDLDYVALIDGCFTTGPFSLAKAFLLGLVPITVMLLIEPILLTSIGTTFGKCIMRIRITHTDGRYLTYTESLKRTWLMLRYGMGFGIPFYDLYRNYKSYDALEAGRVLPWEEDASYTEVFTMNRIYCLIFIIVVVIIIFLK